MSYHRIIAAEYSHIDLNAANKKKITVAEVTGSNVVSVAEHVRD